jgi:hypothetical protein
VSIVSTTFRFLLFLAVLASCSKREDEALK